MWSPATDTLTALVPSTPDGRIFYGRGPFQTPNQTVPQMATALRAVRHTQSPWGEQVGIVLFYPLAAITLCYLYSDDTRSVLLGVFEIHTLCTRCLNIIRFPSRLSDCVAYRIGCTRPTATHTSCRCAAPSNHTGNTGAAAVAVWTTTAKGARSSSVTTVVDSAVVHADNSTKKKGR